MPSDRIKTIVGEIEVDRDRHVRCDHCVRYRPSREHDGKGYCARPIYDKKGKYLRRANELVARDHSCECFVSRLGEQQQQ